MPDVTIGEILCIEFAGMQLQPGIAAPLQHHAVIERNRGDIGHRHGAAAVQKRSDYKRMLGQGRNVD